MENRAFNTKLPDEIDCEAAASSSLSLSTPLLSSDSEKNSKTRYCTMSPADPFGAGAEEEQRPINIHRPVFYSTTFYPALQAATQRSGHNSRQLQCECINHDMESSSLSSSSANISSSSLSILQNSPKLFHQQLSSTTRRLASTCFPNSCNSSCGSLWTTLFPILSWLPKYKVGSDLLADLITGFTILALHIPQGLAYGRLAGVESINGLYVSVFPVVLYAVFGGSRHISMGTFAVICIACKDVLDSFDAQGLVIGGHHFNESTSALTAAQQLQPATKIEILTSLALLVGLIQVGVSGVVFVYSEVKFISNDFFSVFTRRFPFGNTGDTLFRSNHFCLYRRLFTARLH